MTTKDYDVKDVPFDYGAKRPDGQYTNYPVLSESERQKESTKPLYLAYRHVGARPKYPLRDLTDEERGRYEGYHYAKYEEYPPSESSVCGKFWTDKQLTSGCNSVTTISLPIAETYQANPSYYGSTFCVRCRDHFPVGEHGEFVWVDEDGIDTTVKVGT